MSNIPWMHLNISLADKLKDQVWALCPVLELASVTDFWNFDNINNSFQMFFKKTKQYQCKNINFKIEYVNF